MTATLVLQCRGCGKTRRVDNTPVGGLSVEDWFDSRGRLCVDCYAAAGGALGNVKQLVHPPKGLGTIQQRFECFHQLNPWIFDALEELASDLLSRGRRRIGIRMLWEIVRWKYVRSTVDPSSEFKANDHYHSRYVRLLIEKHPEWSEAFELRQLRAS